MLNQLLENAAAMLNAAADGIGPGVLIIVNCSQVQANFWQQRLTGPDAIHGNGTVVPEKTLVMSISEDNWNGRAGNALGILNAMVQSARKAAAVGLLALSPDADPIDLADAWIEHCQRRQYCLSMLHTAGQGKRVAPLPSVEINSKSNIRLPRMIRVGERLQAMTILEAVLLQGNLYAKSRQGRLSVFWGDQIIIHAANIARDSDHHIEVFGQPVPLDDSISAYGVLIAAGNNEYRIREKLTRAQVQALLPPGCCQVYKSIGSFSISLPWLRALLNLKYHRHCLRQRCGNLDCDLHWWQPLTSESKVYEKLMREKNMMNPSPTEQWDRMQQLWNSFAQTSSALRLGVKDVGNAALWWDYGQHKYYLQNLQMLTSPTGKVARAFFGIAENKWQDDASVIGEANISNSVVLHSQISSGNLRNCVVVDSVIDNIEASNAVIIGSTVLRLQANDALCYNVVARETNLQPGQVLANIFHPDHGCIEMRSHTGLTDDDWMPLLHNNPYSFEQLFTMMETTTIRAATSCRQEALARLANSTESR